MIKGESNGDLLKGKDMFDIASFIDPKIRPFFFKFIARLKESCDTAQPSAAHKFFKHLSDRGLLLRGYTQNIDDLEEKVGLTVYNPDVSSGHVFAQIGTKKRESIGLESRPKFIHLHGTLRTVVCTVCRHKMEFDASFLESFSKGQYVECVQCRVRSEDRVSRGRRKTQCGMYRPDIVLYNEPHPMGDTISDFISLDLDTMPTTVIVMGTSLRVPGLKRLVKEMAKAVQRKRAIAPERSGSIVYVNKTPASKGEWRTIFDAEFLGDCDDWVGKLSAQMAKLEIKLPQPLSIVYPSPSQTKITSFFKTTIGKSKCSTKQEDSVFEQSAKRK